MRVWRSVRSYNKLHIFVFKYKNSGLASTVYCRKLDITCQHLPSFTNQFRLRHHNNKNNENSEKIYLAANAKFHEVIKVIGNLINVIISM